MKFPAKLLREEDGITVTFPDVPEAITCGNTEAEALLNAEDALETALDFYFDGGRPVPSPSPLKRGQRLVGLSPSVTAKVLLHNEMLAQKVRPAELARRLNMPRQNMSRLFNRRHGTSIDGLADALAALGKQLEIVVH